MVQRSQSSPSSLLGSYSHLWTMKGGIPFPNFTKKSILIAVMGMTGAGKTYFIKQVTGLDEMEVGHGLKSCTKEIQVATTHIDDYEVHLIDTPGFDDDELNDTDILLEIANYLQTGVKLSGIIYLHPISDSRIGGTGKRNLELLQNLVGQENMGNVKLITTKWRGATHEEGKARLDDLVSSFWNGMIAAGAQVDHYDGTDKDGKRIVQSLLKRSPVELLLQQELQRGDEMAQTSAGKLLTEAFSELQEKYDRKLKKLERDRKTEREEYKEALERQAKAAEQARKLQDIEIESLRRKVEDLEKEWKCVVM